MKKYLFCVLSILIATAAQGQDFKTMEGQKAAFLEKAISTLSIKVDPVQLKNIKSYADKWKFTKNEEDWVKVTDAVYMASKTSDSKSQVTISSSGGNGATVKYQTLGQRKRNETPTTAKAPTVTKEEMYIGMYHIWSERKGSPTSNKNDQFDIAKQEEQVTLKETN